jgi:hypothetical protein
MAAATIFRSVVGNKKRGVSCLAPRLPVSAS